MILSGKNTESIRKHFLKIFGYRSEGYNLCFVIIWGFSENPDNTWKGYREVINEVLPEVSEFPFVSIRDILELINPEIRFSFPSFVTEHRDQLTGNSIFVIHTYIDLLNSRERKIARYARQKTKTVKKIKDISSIYIIQ